MAVFVGKSLQELMANGKFFKEYKKMIVYGEYANSDLHRDRHHDRPRNGPVLVAALNSQAD